MRTPLALAALLLASSGVVTAVSDSPPARQHLETAGSASVGNPKVAWRFGRQRRNKHGIHDFCNADKHDNVAAYNEQDMQALIDTLEKNPGDLSPSIHAGQSWSYVSLTGNALICVYNYGKIFSVLMSNKEAAWAARYIGGNIAAGAPTENCCASQTGGVWYVPIHTLMEPRDSDFSNNVPLVSSPGGFCTAHAKVVHRARRDRVYVWTMGGSGLNATQCPDLGMI